MSRGKTILYGLLSVALSLTLFLVAAEIILRVLPVADGARTAPVDAQHPVFHSMPNYDFVYSRGWDMVMVNRGHVNNAGFVNDQDYAKDQSSLPLAVIGDSYIEASMVAYPETLHGRLASALRGRLRVYSFAASGAPLSQYLIWARHAIRDYGAYALIINVIGNDFDESLSAYKSAPGFWLYVPDEKGVLRLRLFEYHPSMRREFVYRSALMRYLFFNFNITNQLDNLKSIVSGLTTGSPRYAGNTLSDASPARVRDSLAAINAFFRDLPDYTGLPPSRILFVVDGSRYPSAAAAAKGSYFEAMRKVFLEKARSLGYQAIDLDPYFFERYRRTGERFEFARDGHWSSTGHTVAFEAVMASPFLAGLISAAAAEAEAAPTRMH